VLGAAAGPAGGRVRGEDAEAAVGGTPAGVQGRVCGLLTVTSRPSLGFPSLGFLSAAPWVSSAQRRRFRAAALSCESRMGAR